MIADTACFSFLFPFPFASPFLFLYISLLFPCISLLHPHPVGAGLCSALPHKITNTPLLHYINIADYKLHQSHHINRII